MGSRKVFIDKSTAIDRVASLSAEIRNVAALDNEPVLDFMYLRVKEVQFLIIDLAVFPCAKGSEVLRGLGCEIVKQLEDNPASRSGSNLHIHVDPIIRF